MDTKILAGEALGAGIGALQTPLLREEVDRKYPLTNIPQLKGFGTPSALIGLAAGGTATAAAAVGTTKGKDGRPRLKDEYVHPLAAYGVVTLVSAILSGVFPAVTEADCVAKGGYYYDGACHKTPPAGVTGMQPQVQVATRPYTPPASVQQPSVDMNVIRQMTVEIQRLTGDMQRLSSENAALRAQVQAPAAPAIEVTQIIPGAVKRRQEEYGFMADTQQPLVTKRTEMIRKKFDFMG